MTDSQIVCGQVCGVTHLLQGRLAEAEAGFARCRELGGTLKPEAERLWREVRQKRMPK